MENRVESTVPGGGMTAARIFTGFFDREALTQAALDTGAVVQRSMVDDLLYVTPAGWKGPLLVDLGLGDVVFDLRDAGPSHEYDLMELGAAYSRRATAPTPDEETGSGRNGKPAAKRQPAPKQRGAKKADAKRAGPPG